MNNELTIVVPVKNEERLIGQLASINATLLRASKKANPPAFSVER